MFIERFGGIRLSGRNNRTRHLLIFLFAFEFGQRLKEWPELERVTQEVVFSGESQASGRASTKRWRECLKKKD